MKNGDKAELFFWVAAAVFCVVAAFVYNIKDKNTESTTEAATIAVTTAAETTKEDTTAAVTTEATTTETTVTAADQEDEAGSKAGQYGSHNRSGN